MNFVTLLEQHVAQRPEAIAFYDIDRPVSYRELLAESSRVASVLYDQGARPGDRLALWLPNCTAWLTTFMACARLGVMVIAMNTRFRSREVGDLVARGKCQWLALWPTFKDLPFQEILDGVAPGDLQNLKGVMVIGDSRDTALLPKVKKFDYSLPASTAVLNNVPPGRGDAYALVYTTSGTTSQSKLVVHDQQALIGHGENAARHFGIGRDDAILLGAPLCGAFGFSSALAGLAAGAALVWSPVLNASECAAQILQRNVTHIFANNELLNLILDAAPSQEHPFPSLRVAGFASFSPSLENLPQRAEKAGIKLVGLYGSSELQALVAGQMPDAPLAQRELAGGKLVAPTARVRVRNVETNDVLPHGELGEIEIKAPSLMKGYLDDEKATAAVMDAEGYFRTGDLGYTIDNQSFIYHARLGDFLRLGGFLVNPLEIEQFIESLEGVAHCQVVGVAQGEKTVAVAFIIPDPGHSVQAEAIIARCKSQLAGFKVPVRVSIVDAFPVVESANSNKIQRSKLQMQALALLKNS